MIVFCDFGRSFPFQHTVASLLEIVDTNIVGVRVHDILCCPCEIYPSWELSVFSYFPCHAKQSEWQLRRDG